MQKNYRCPRCHATLEYDPEIGKMRCKYCGSVYAVPKSEEVSDAKNQEELTKTQVQGDAQAYAREEQQAKKEREATEKRKEARQHARIKMQILHCNSCGAELAVNEVEASSFCAYCGQATVVLDRVEEYLEPDYIIPFSVTKEKAEANIRERIKNGYYIPKAIKNFEVENLRGIYIPFWLCDIYYGDEKYYKYTQKYGKSYAYKYAHRIAEMQFKKLTQDASKQLNDDTTARLEPYDMGGLCRFEPMYLSGFYADRFDVGTEDSEEVVLRRAKKLFDKAVEQDVDRRNKRLTYANPVYKVIKTDYALLPAWFLTFRIDDQPYTILVNGQTGKTVGAVPCVKGKAITVFSILSILFSALMIPWTSFLSGSMFLAIHTEGAMLWIMGLWVMLGIVGGVAWVKGLKKLSDFRDSIGLTCSGATRSFVNERQEK